MLAVKNVSELTIEIVESFFKEFPVESITHEYKREMYQLQRSESKKEFLKDITAFANSEGGDLIIGIDELEGVIGAIIENIDTFKQQLDSIIRDNVDPPLSNYQIQELNLSLNTYLIIIRVKKSYLKPHRISKQSQDFFTRGPSGKYPIKISQLRELFISSNEIKREISSLIANRVNSILSDDTFYSLDLNNPVFILHIIPIQSLEENIFIELKNMHKHKELLVPIAHRFGYLTESNNFDGYSRYVSNGQNVEAYVQSFNNGVIESVNTWMLSVDSQFGPYIHSDNFATTLITGIEALAKFLDLIGIIFPVVLHLELHGVKNVKLGNSSLSFDMLYSSPKLRQNVLRFPSLTILNNAEISKKGYTVKLIKSWMDLLWRAFGHANCKRYQENKYLGEDRDYEF